MMTLSFWKQALERAIKTAAQAALAFFVVGQTIFAEIDWAVVGGGVLVAFIASVLTSIVSSPFGPKDSPSLVQVPTIGKTP